MDDANLWQTQNQSTCGIFTMVVDLQDAAQWWEKILFVSGSKLELSKCFVQVLHWSFDEKGSPCLVSLSKLPYKVILQSSETKEPVNIKFS